MAKNKSGSWSSKTKVTWITRNTWTSKNWTWSVSLSNWASIWYTTVWWKSTYSYWGKTYSDAKSAVNAASSYSWWSSKWGSSSSRGSGSSFVDPSVLQDQHMGMSNEDIAKKWWGTDANGNSWSSTAWWTKVLQALNKNNRVYWTWGYTEYNPNTGLYSKPSSSSSSSTTSDVVWQYWDASYKNYTNAFNNYKSQWMSDEDARSQASKLLENENLLNTKSDDDIAMETQADDDEDARLNDLFYWLDLEWDDEYSDAEEEDYNPNEDIFRDDRLSRIEDTVNNFIDSYDKNDNKTENTVENKAEVSHDPIFDYNTYFQNNIVWDTAKVWQTWEQAKQPEISNNLTDSAKEYDEVTQSLQNLGFLEPNGEASATMPNTEVNEAPKLYDNADSIISDFNSQFEWVDENWVWLTPEEAVKKYSEFKWQLKKLRDNNWITNEEYLEYLKQLQQNPSLRNILIKNRK